MAHSLLAPLASSSPPISTRNHAQLGCHQSSIDMQCSKTTVNFCNRRAFVCGLVGVSLPLINGGADAAQKRAPPRPPSEKKDPNVSGVLAKVLASKRRKEAMQEEIARLREKGKPVS